MCRAVYLCLSVCVSCVCVCVYALVVDANVLSVRQVWWFLLFVVVVVVFARSKRFLFGWFLISYHFDFIFSIYCFFFLSIVSSFFGFFFFLFFDCLVLAFCILH